MSRALVVAAPVLACAWCLCVVLALLGAGRTAAAQSATSRLIGHATMHHGVAIISEDIDDGADSPGVALGMQFGGQFRFTRTFSAGIAIDATFSSHESNASATAKAKYTHYFLPTLVARYELGRFALLGWGGFHLGHRTVSEPGGLFGSTSFRDDDLRGVVLAGAAVVRFRPATAPVMVEIGPFVQTAILSSGDDAAGSVRTLVLGLAFAATYGAPGVDGNAL